MSEVNLGNGNNFLVTTAKNITMWEHLTVMNGSKVVQLDVKIEANFDTIPEEYHEIFLNMMSARYYGKASFGDNPFSQCVPIKTKKWFQFWK